MASTRLLLALVLIVPCSYGQHRGGFGGGFGHSPGTVAVRSSGFHSMRSRALQRGNRYGRGGFGYGSPYFPAWDYDTPLEDYGDNWLDQYPQYPSAGNVLVFPPPSETFPPPAPKPASLVIHEYHFAVQSATPPGGERPTLTVVLKDGSRREAQASWVAAGKLHYVDLQSRQQVLSSDIIDRDATQRANQANNLSMELPPG